jgi:hypothetical protein
VSLENVMLASDGTCCLIDLGLSICVPHDPEGEPLPMIPQPPVGKPGYMVRR